MVYQNRGFHNPDFLTCFQDSPRNLLSDILLTYLNFRNFRGLEREREREIGASRDRETDRGLERSGKSKRGLGPKGANWAKKGPFEPISALPRACAVRRDWSQSALKRLRWALKRPQFAPKSPDLPGRISPPIFSENLGLKPPFVSPRLDFPKETERERDREREREREREKQHKILTPEIVSCCFGDATRLHHMPSSSRAGRQGLSNRRVVLLQGLV